MELPVARLIVEQNPEMEIVENYSGRGMFGRETCGVKYSDLTELIDAIVLATIEDPDIMQESDIRGFDQLGRDRIIY